MTQAFNDRTPLQRLLWLGGMAKAAGGKGVEETASGNPVVFTTDLARPLSRLALSLLPRQSGTGNPSPENIRPLLPWGGVNVEHCGKNLAKLTYGNKVPSFSTGQMVSSNGWSTDFIRVDKTKNYYCSGYIYSNGNVYALYYGADGAFLGYVSHSASFSPNGFMLNSDSYFSSATYIKLRNDSSESTVLTIQLEEGTSASAYAQYTGQTYPVVFPALGKNLFDKNATNTANGYVVNRYLTENNVLNETSNYNVSEYIPVSEGDYTLSPLTGGGPSICFYDNNKAFLKGVSYSSYETRTAKAPTGTAYCRISIPKANVDTLQLEHGSSATAYEPFNNTVYGGFVDLVTGEVWGTWAMLSLRWDEFEERGQTNPETGLRAGKQTFPLLVEQCTSQSAYGTKTVCNITSEIKWSGADVSPAHYFINKLGILWMQLPETTPEDEIIQVAAKLVTPVLLATLTPQQINALVGVNTVWSDADGIELTYLKKG